MKIWRIYTVWFFLILAFSGIVWRLVDLSIIDRPFLLKKSQARILRKISIPAYRGMILDRLGTALAISTPLDSIWINPQTFHPDDSQLQALANILNLPMKQIKVFIQLHHHRQFVYLKRDNPPDIIEKIKALKILGLNFQREYHRFYPEGEIAAHVVGQTNIDDQGQEGLEFAYNNWLAGEAGEKEVLKDRLGHIIQNVALLKKPEQGHDLTLSIDHRLQYLSYRVLKDTVDKYHAQAGSVVILAPKTGEILAMVNQPSYNPNNRDQKHDDRYRNRAVTDMFEPGSVIKSFTVTFALESGRYNLDTLIDTNPGWMRVGGFPIHDDYNYGVVNLTQLLEKSSNIAAAKILLSLNPKSYWDLLHEFGFGERTASAFPGEADGRLDFHDKWGPSVIATLAYGYGMSVTALQLAQAYGVLAADGVKYPVSFLKTTSAPKGQRLLPHELAQTIIQMLESVVQEGTGARASVPGYHIAGKTGTAYIAGPNGYNRHQYMSSFVGMAPASHPELVVAVIIRDPKGKHFAADVAAPAFSEVMGETLRILNVPPDNIK